MSRIIYVFVFILISFISYSQTDFEAKIDSVQKLLTKSKPDTSQVNLLLKLSQYSRGVNNYQNAYDYAIKAKDVSKRLRFNKGLAEAYAHIGDIYLSANNDSVIHYYEKALTIAKEIRNRPMAAKLSESLALSYSGDNYKKSLEYFDTALKLYRQEKDMKKYHGALVQLGYVYKIKGEHYKSADVFIQLMAGAEKFADTSHIIMATSQLGDIYYGQGNLKKALQYYFKELKLYRSYKGSTYMSLGVCGLKISKVYFEQKNFKEALRYSYEALDFSEKSKNLQLKSSVLLTLTEIYTKTKDTKNAIKYFEKAVVLKNSNVHNPWSKMFACVSLGEAAFNMANYEVALQYHLESLVISEQLSIAEQTAIAHGNIGATYVTLAKQESARSIEMASKGVNHLRQAIEYLKTTNNIGNLELYTWYLYEGFEVTGRAAEALEAYKEHITYKDSTFNKSKRDEFNAKQMDYEYGKKEALLKAQQVAEIEQEQTMRNFSFAGIGVLFVLAGGAGVAYRRKRRDNKIIVSEKKRSDELLLNILPHEVAEELKEKGEAAAHYYEHVSILFTDFENFTQISSKMSPQEVIGELNYCFKAFDQIITKYNIEKIKTIGDAYMAVSGLPSSSPDHALNVVKAAIDIRDFIVDYKEQRKREGKTYFEMRIGINSGEVVAGIVGIKKFAYDIWGDAVNIAARMESNGVVGKINISESTYELVKDEFDAEYRGEIEAKGKGKVRMYFAEPKKSTIGI